MKIAGKERESKREMNGVKTMRRKGKEEKEKGQTS